MTDIAKLHKPLINRVIGHGDERVDQLLAHPDNFRIHTQQQQQALAGAIDDIGYIHPVIVNRTTGRILDGHLRVTLALRSGVDTLPVDYVELSEADEAKALLMLDPIAAMAAADREKLDYLLRQVQSDDERIQALMAEIAEREGLDYGAPPADDPGAPPADDPGAQIDRAEELRLKWGVEPGQLWQLGEHRLICGDCTDRAVVDRVMGGEKAAITFTSPPYNAGVSAKLRGNTSIDDNLYKDEYDDNKTQYEYLKLLDGFTRASLDVSGYVFVNIQFLSGNKRAFVDYMTAYRDRLADIAIWDKGHAAPAAALRVMDSRFEFILIFSEGATRAIGTREFRGMVHNVYSGSPQRHNEYSDVHAATFPVDFPEHFVGTFTNPGELIFEPFTGTGTTLIACEQLGRKCRAVEISPAYVAVALERWSQLTGQQPRRVE